METRYEQQAATSEQFNRKAQDLINVMFVLCEKHMEAAAGKPNQGVIALTASALAVQEAVKAFLAVKRTL